MTPRRCAASAIIACRCSVSPAAEELALVRSVARALIAGDALRSDAYGGLSFGPGAKPILKGEQGLIIAVPPQRRKRRRERGAEEPADPLFEALRVARRDLAAESGVPPYVVFHNSTLREMAAARPATLAELAKISGVGEAKLARYGSAMLAAVAAVG